MAQKSARSSTRAQSRPPAKRPGAAREAAVARPRPAPVPPGISTSAGTAHVRLAWLAPLLVGAGGLVIAIVGVLVSLALSVVGALVLLAGVALFVLGERIGSTARLAKTIGGETVTAREEPRLVNLVEGICVASGLPVPRLVVLDDPAPNAIALGRRRADTVLVTTAGALRLLDRIELEALLAHELAHVRRGDTERASYALSACGALALVSGRATERVAHLAGDGREALADLAGMSVTNFPPGLASALEKLDAAPSVVPAGLDPLVVRLTGQLWCAPLGPVAAVETVPGALDLELRICALREL